MKRCFKVTLEYDGTDFCGFQYQVGQRSVQDDVEKAILQLTGQAVRINGAGRTDTGVHALGQVIGFQVDTRIPTERMVVALNSALPRDVAATAAVEVDELFHARFSAKSRSYAYLILNRPARSAVYDRFSCHWPHKLDVSAMRDGAQSLVGRQDFVAWANETEEVRTTVRTVMRCGLRRAGSFILFRIEADAFLRSMVRNIVGTLLEVGGGKRPASDVARITESRDRTQAGPTAPARGLCLVRVQY